MAEDMCLEVLFINTKSRIGDKRQHWWNPTYKRDQLDFLCKEWCTKFPEIIVEVQH